MTRLPLDFPLEMLAEPFRSHYAMLCASDAPTKIDGVGWRVNDAIWLFETDEKGELNTEQALAFGSDIAEHVNEIGFDNLPPRIAP